MSATDATPEGDALRELREGSKLSRRVVAERLGLGVQQLRWIEIRGPRGEEASQVRQAIMDILGGRVGAVLDQTRQDAPEDQSGMNHRLRCPGCQVEVETLGVAAGHRCPNGLRWRNFEVIG